MTDVTRLSAGELALGMRGGSLSCAEVMEAFAARIRAHNPRVNALIQVDLDGAMAQAEEADARIARGEPVGPLIGLPIAIKDNFDALGFRTTYGAPALRENWAREDSLHVARMRAAGAIIVGKTNMPEFAFGPDTDNPLWGRTRNPYRLDRTAGSSSGGTGAALALDMIPLSDGSDLGGSTRVPASWCNVVGFRPSTGVCPKVPSVAPFDRLHVMGPMARRVDDIRLALSVAAGPDPRSPIAAPFGPEEFAGPLTGDLTGFRIAYCANPAGFAIDPEVPAALAPCADALAGAGARVEEADPDIAFMAKSQRVFRALCAAEYAGWAADEFGLELGHTILDLVAQSRRLTGLEIERAYSQRVKAWRRLSAFFERFDLICWPTTAGPAYDPQAPESADFDWGTVYISPALDLPTISVPGGFTRDGLPLGLQIIGPPGCDRRVLEAAEAVERARPLWWSHPPRTTLEAVE